MRQHTAQHLDQRRFARSILAAQRVQLRSVQLEARAVTPGYSFVIMRASRMGSAMSGPFYVNFAMSRIE